MNKVTIKLFRAYSEERGEAHNSSERFHSTFFAG